MAVATFLHIHRSGDRAVRAVALAGDEVRVGRGPLCEVQIDASDVAAVHLVLKRRGEYWSVKPLGGPRSVRLDGEPLLETVRLQPGSVLELGGHRLKLVLMNPDDAAVQPGSFSRPITLGTAWPATPRAAELPQMSLRGEAKASLTRPEPPIPQPEPRPSRPSRPETKVVSKPGRSVALEPAWQSGDDRTRSWLESRRDLRRRAEDRSPWTQEPAWVPAPPQAVRPPVCDYSRWTSAPTVVPMPEMRTVPPRKRAPAVPDPKIDDEPRPNDLPQTPPQPSVHETKHEPPAAEPDALQMPPLGAEHANKPECPAAAPSVEAGESSVAIDFDLPEDFDRLARSDRIAADADLEAGRTGASASQPSTTGKPDASRAWQFSRPDEHATGGMPRPEGPGPVDSEPGRCEPESEHWPSIRSIWRPAIGTTAERGDSRSRREAFVPSATAIRGPELWRPPVWIAVPALLAAALVVGGGAIGLSWSWADDARVAGPVANYWTSGDVTGAIARFAQPPNLAWWATTADALVLHAASVAATAQDALDREDQRTMLDLAAAASPTHPGVRFARQASGGKRPQGAPTSVASQDVASLGLAAVRGLAAGQRSAAIDRLRDALALSARLEPEIAEYPALDREANGLRLELPQEDVVNRLLRAVGSQITRGKLDWEEVMPDHAGPWLALYRWSRSHARSEARSILERIASLPAYPDSGDLAWHRAARAEALAAAGKWSDAASAYRESLELKPGPLLASVVWFNLGDILARLGEADAARQARRTSRQLAAALPDRPREQARQLHETLEGDGPIRISSSR